MKKNVIMSLGVALLVGLASSASAETTGLAIKFKGNVRKSNTGTSVIGVTASGTAPFASATLQSSVDGRTHWKSFTRPFTFSDTGTAVKRVDARTIGKKGQAVFIRAETFGQNTAPVTSPAVQER